MSPAAARSACRQCRCRFSLELRKHSTAIPTAPSRRPKIMAHFWVALIRTCSRVANDFYGTAKIRTLSSSSASLLQLCSTSKYAFCNSGSFVCSANSLQRAAYCLHSSGSSGWYGSTCDWR
jgi:hypothetical protein